MPGSTQLSPPLHEAPPEVTSSSSKASASGTTLTAALLEVSSWCSSGSRSVWAARLSHTACSPGSEQDSAQLCRLSSMPAQPVSDGTPGRRLHSRGEMSAMASRLTYAACSRRDSSQRGCAGSATLGMAARVAKMQVRVQETGQRPATCGAHLEVACRPTVCEGGWAQCFRWQGPTAAALSAETS